MLFELVHINKTQYEIRASSNNKYIGRAIMDVDGFFYIDLISGDGVWSAESLIEMGNMVKELNKGMEEHLESYFKDHKDDEDFNDDLW